MNEPSLSAKRNGIRPFQVTELLEFLNDDFKFPIDPLLKMAMAHYQFEAIHPFRDGNGVTGHVPQFLTSQNYCRINIKTS